MPIIETKDVKKVYTKSSFNWRKFGIDKTIFHALKGMDLSIEAGEFLGFIGPNGAGKTTFLKILSGIMVPTNGMVNVMGFYPFDKKFEYLKQIALVMGQKNALWWDLPAIDSFHLQKDIYGVKETDFRTRLNEIGKVLDIEELLQKRLRSMSLGERMKCELSACLLHRPRVVFLDEPTIGLDVVSSRAIRKFLKKMNEEEGITFILTSHYLADIEELCKRVVIINKGEKIYDGQLQELKRKYAPEKEIKVYLETEDEKELFNELAVGGKKIEDDSGIITAKSSEVGDIASDLFNTFGAENITIGEPDIEEVIVKIFKQ